MKDFSNLVRVPILGTGTAKDLGTWYYTVMFNMMYELSRGMTHPVCEHFNILAFHWPSLDYKWKATKGSGVKKGDVVEVAIALCKRSQRGLTSEQLREHQLYLFLCGQFYERMDLIIGIMCDCDGPPQYIKLLHPFHCSRLLHFAYMEKRARNPEWGTICGKKAHEEVKFLQCRVG